MPKRGGAGLLRGRHGLQSRAGEISALTTTCGDRRGVWHTPLLNIDVLSWGVWVGRKTGGKWAENGRRMDEMGWAYGLGAYAIRPCGCRCLPMTERGLPSFFWVVVSNINLE
jgi:hypothetical protein